MSTVANLRIRIGSDFDGSGFDKVAQSAAEIGQKFQDVGKSLSMYVTAPIVAAGTLAVRAFDKQEKAVAGVEAALRSTGGAVGYTSGELVQMAADLQKVTLFADEDILSGVTRQLLTFPSITGDVFAQAQKTALDLSATLGTDLKSSSIMLGKALQDPARGLTALRRVGVGFTADQETLIKSLAETGRLAEAQGLILQAIATSGYGGMAEAAALAGTGPLTQFMNSLGDLSEMFGKIIWERIAPLVTWLHNLVLGFQTMSPAMQGTIVTVLGIAAAIGPLLFGIGTLLKMLPLLGAGFAVVTGPIGLTIAAIGALVAAGVYLYREYESVRVAFASVWDSIKNVVSSVIDSISFVIRAFLEAGKLWWSVYGDYITTVATHAFENIATVISTVLNVVAGVISGFLAFFRGDWVGVFTSVHGVFGAIWSGMLTIVVNAVDGILAAIQMMVGAIPGAGGIVSSIKGAREWVQGFKGTGTPALPEIAAGGAGAGALGGKDLPKRDTPTITTPLSDEAKKSLAAIKAIGVELARIDAVAAGFGKDDILGPMQQKANAITAFLQKAYGGEITASQGVIDSYRSQLDELNLALEMAAGAKMGQSILAKMLDAEAAGIEQSFLSLDDVMIDVGDRLWTRMDEWKSTIESMGSVLRDGLNSAIGGLAEGFGAMLAGTGTLEDMGKALLGTFAGVMQQLGGLLIAFGTAGVAFGGFPTFLTNPFAAIAAGGLLIAAGSAIKGLLSKGGKAAAGGGGGTTSIGINPNSASRAGTSQGRLVTPQQQQSRCRSPAR